MRITPFKVQNCSRIRIHPTWIVRPSGTSVSFQFRSSNDSFNMGAWSDTVFSPNTPLAGILADSTRLLQYRVILEMSDPEVSPELTEVAFSYTLQVVIGGVVPVRPCSWHKVGNSILFCLNKYEKNLLRLIFIAECLPVTLALV